MAGLAVNVDHIATLREARKVHYPDPVAAAALVEMAGADGVVVHLRGDRRHIQDRDVELLRKTVKTKLILEMASTEEMIGIALEIKPDLVTLVPETDEEVSTLGGLDLLNHQKTVSVNVMRLKEAGIPVSIFIDPVPDQIRVASDIHADMIEIHTGSFCDALENEIRNKEFSQIVESVKYAAGLGLGINAGHGICYDSIKAFKGLIEIDEFSIGHSIISRASFVGLDQAVRDMFQLVKEL